jgi:Tfp pilus assembly PilM family ATPase/Tfp pilus assembly protein PilN
MSRLIAVEWDSREARLAVATAHDGRLVLDDLFAVPLRAAETPLLNSKEIGTRIAGELSQRHLKAGDAVVAIGRAGIELRLLQLPAAPEEELPDLVRFQALREFHSLDETWPLDFLPLGRSADEPWRVLAAAVSPEIVQQIEECCRAAELRPSHLVLRPTAMASLFLAGPDAQRQTVRLLVDILADEADLTVLAGTDVVFLRTARLAGDPTTDESVVPPLVGELRRTLAAANSQLSGARIEAVYLCGADDEQQRLAERLSQALGLPVYNFQPLDVVPPSPRLAGRLPQRVGRFAPLLGMLRDEAAGRRHPIDFLHPRRRPPPPSRRRRVLWSVAAAAAVVAISAGGILWRLSSLEHEAADLLRRSKALDASVNDAQQSLRAVQTIETWTAGEVIWLDELRNLVDKVPEARDAMLLQLRMSSRPRGGAMELQGLVREAATVDALERALRDARHRVEGQSRQQYREAGHYRWRFESTVFVEPHASPAPSAAAASPAASTAPATQGAN